MWFAFLVDQEVDDATARATSTYARAVCAYPLPRSAAGSRALTVGRAQSPVCLAMRTSCVRGFEHCGGAALAAHFLHQAKPEMRRPGIARNGRLELLSFSFFSTAALLTPVFHIDEVDHDQACKSRAGATWRAISSAASRLGFRRVSFDRASLVAPAGVHVGWQPAASVTHGFTIYPPERKLHRRVEHAAKDSFSTDGARKPGHRRRCKCFRSCVETAMSSS